MLTSFRIPDQYSFCNFPAKLKLYQIYMWQPAPYVVSLEQVILMKLTLIQLKYHFFY